jgi:hypothetical protein
LTDAIPEMHIVRRTRAVCRPDDFIQAPPEVLGCWLVGGNGTATPIPSDLADVLAESGVETAVEEVP